jgi:hypothetical protein
MTAKTDFDRVLDAFLAEGAETIPDRVIDVALSEIDRTRQGPAIRLPRRVSRMPASLRLLAVAAVIATATGIAFTFAGGNRPPTPPSPPPASAFDGTLSFPLIGSWTSTLPAAGDRPAGRYQLDLAIDAGLVGPDPSAIPIPLGAVNSIASNIINFGPTGSCRDPSGYSWSLSPDRFELTLSAVDDTCTSRRSALTLSKWRRYPAGIPTPGLVYLADDVPPGIKFTAPAGLGRARFSTNDQPYRFNLGSRDEGFTMSITLDSPVPVDPCDERSALRAPLKTLYEYQKWLLTSNMRTMVFQDPFEIGGHNGFKMDVTGKSSCRNLLDHTPGQDVGWTFQSVETWRYVSYMGEGKLLAVNVNWFKYDSDQAKGIDQLVESFTFP